MADIAKAQALLDYTPRVSLTAGLEMLYRHDPLFQKVDKRKPNMARMLGFALWSNGAD